MTYLTENNPIILCFSCKWILKATWKECMLKFQQYVVWVERNNETLLYLISEASRIFSLFRCRCFSPYFIAMAFSFLTDMETVVSVLVYLISAELILRNLFRMNIKFIPLKMISSEVLIKESWSTHLRTLITYMC